MARAERADGTGPELRMGPLAGAVPPRPLVRTWPLFGECYEAKEGRALLRRALESGMRSILVGLRELAWGRGGGSSQT